jgi:hypothetical protein
VGIPKEEENVIIPVLTEDGIEVPVLRWIDLHSEDICALYTHTPKPKNKSTYSLNTYDRDEWGEKNSTGKPIIKGRTSMYIFIYLYF